MIACAQPSFLTAFFLIFLPESPKFCLHVRQPFFMFRLFERDKFYFNFKKNGQEMEAKKILRNIYTINNKSQSLDDLDRKKVSIYS